MSDEIKELRTQLAYANDMWDRASRQADTLAEYLVDAKAELSVTQTKLAAAQAVAKAHNDINGDICHIDTTDTAALNAAIKPFVELLEKVDTMMYRHIGDDTIRAEIKAALAQVKEGK